MDKYMQDNVEMSLFSRNYLDLKRDMPIRPSEMGVLNIIANRPGQHTAVMLAERINVSRPMITAHLKVLLKKGYVEKQQSAEDKRISYLYLTQKGKELVESARVLMNENLDMLREGMGEEKYEQLVELLKNANEILMAERTKRFAKA